MRTYQTNAERQKAYRERYRNRIESRIETTEEQIARLTDMIRDLTQLLQGMGIDTVGREDSNEDLL